MATYRQTVTTTANTVSTITLPIHFDSIQVDNDDKTTDGWVRVDGIDPTVAGAECMYLRAGSSLIIGNPLPNYEPALGISGQTIIKVISTGAIQVTAGEIP